MHEFGKKHCYNLLRLSKNKSILTKHKKQPEVAHSETPKVKIVSHSGVFSKYGYFVPGEVYSTPELQKKFNTDYDPYLQKYAENPLKRKATETISSFNESKANAQPTAITYTKKKKKKINTCEICKITFTTVPDYESHMKSPQHMWQLKNTGIGVSAHFVRASTDLHTTDIAKNFGKQSLPSNNADKQNLIRTDLKSESFPSLFCDVCDLLLNSPQQYNVHLSDKTHLECTKRKAVIKAKKEKIHNPTPNQLYCYSCQVSLNNITQYKEHRNGKKHKLKCMKLMKEGITIPPEERLAEWITPKLIFKKPLVYPELYEKLFLEKGNEACLSLSKTSPNHVINSYKDIQNKTMSHSNYSLLPENSASTAQINNSIQAGLHSNTDTLNVISENFKGALCRFLNETGINHYLNKGAVLSNVAVCKKEIIDFDLSDQKELKPGIIFDKSNSAVYFKEDKNSSQSFLKIFLLGEKQSFKCSVCSKNFNFLTEFDSHLDSESHLREIFGLRQKGISEKEILEIIMGDRISVKREKSGKITCSICSVINNSIKEYEQHVNSFLHKYTLNDYKEKKAEEVKNMGQINQQGLFYCDVCSESYNFLTEFCQHIHLIKHRAERTKKESINRKAIFFQKSKNRRAFKK